jgi:4-diphosphocytidyl-2-C-methyl-D-erythritol kinase
MSVTVRSFAKINLGLLIGPPGARTDGFHELRTLYQTIALHDVIKVAVSGGGRTGIEIQCKHRGVPSDESNTCWKVADRALKTWKLRARVTITIEKHLPVQGGMGAASSNAVATLFALEKAAKRSLEPAERLRIASEVGSDLPLFLLGGTVLGIGRGEQVFPLADLPQLDLVAATPGVGVSTPKAFAAWDELFRGPSSLTGASLTTVGQTDRMNMFSQQLYAWLGKQSSPVATGVSARGRNRAEALLLDLVRTGIENDFERVVFPQFPEIRDVKRALERLGASYCSLSGSGSTVFGIFAEKKAAERAAKALVKQGTAAQATVTLGREQYWKRLFA